MRKLRSATGLALAELRHRWVRTTLGVIAIAVAVVATVSLLSLGVSVLEIGDAGFTRIGGDLWMTAGSVAFAPGAVGGVEAPLVDAHSLSADVERHDGVDEARALGLQTVYVATEPGEYETIVGAGITGDGDVFETTAGRSFEGADSHYANGSYDGPMTNEVLIDRRAAALLDVEVGDTVHVGGTLVEADENEFEVIGISNDVARYIGAPTVMVQLGELQRVSSTTGTDPATAVLITLDGDADPKTVQSTLQHEYDEYEVRTNREQFEAVLRGQSTVLAGAATVVILAVLGGAALVGNVLGLFVYQQRAVLAALRAIGVSTGTLLRMTLVQGLVIATLGAVLGIAITVPAVELLNDVVEIATGFEDIVSAPRWAFAVGGGVALAMGLLGASVSGWLVTRISPLAHLSR